MDELKIYKRNKKRLKDLRVRVSAQRAGVRAGVCSASTFTHIIFITSIILTQLSLSVGLTFYQKWFIKRFNFPLSVTVAHLILKFFLSCLVRALSSTCRHEDRVLLGWKMYWTRLAPTGVAGALDIGISNWSFEFITISLYTMTKSTCIVFILAFGIMFKLEKMRCGIVLTVALISSGLFFFTYKSVDFDVFGFILVLSASVLCGLRWTLAQVVTQRKHIGLSNPFDMIYHIQPWMILGLLPLAVYFEGIHVATSIHLFRYHQVSDVWSSLALVCVGASIAFLLETAEFLVITHTSALTQSVAGIFKEIVTLILAHNINGDHFSTLNLIGLFMCVSGISLHVISKSIRESQKAAYALEDEDCRRILLPLNGSAGGSGSDGDDDDVEDVLFDRVANQRYR